jgi:hypothetical protein
LQRAAAYALLALAASAILAAAGVGPPVAVAHLAFAVGIVPLIFAAIAHFVPVLTRTGDPEPRIFWLPAIARLAGLLAAGAMAGLLPRAALHAAAVADLALASMLLHWIGVRAGDALGSTHPGWRWYGAALASFMLALIAVLAMALAPGQWAALRSFHLHLNTLGLVGLAALGTLPVLLPTALGAPDPDAAGWLRRRLWPVAGGALAVATGAAFSWPFAVGGGAVLLVVVLGLAAQWVRRYGVARLGGDGVAASLLAALVGLMVTLLSGALHAAGLQPAAPSVAAWAACFLLPLVTGALGQLLPVWHCPGPVTARRTALRARLARGGGLRGLLFLAAGGALLWGEAALGAAFAIAGLALFALALAEALRVSRSTG